MKLCGNYLPWVDRVLHLGNTVTNQADFMKTDMAIKNAKYVSKSIEINQEFYFAAAKTRLEINNIYNFSWYGSILWNLFGADAIKLESSYNRSVKCTMNLPLATHRCLIEALSERRHLKWFLINRFLSFLMSMEKSNKPLLKVLKEVTERDTMSRTGRNLREILLITGKNDISELSKSEVDKLNYFPMSEEDEWKIELINMILEEQENSGLDEGSNELLNLLCTN